MCPGWCFYSWHLYYIREMRSIRNAVGVCAARPREYCINIICPISALCVCIDVNVQLADM